MFETQMQTIVAGIFQEPGFRELLASMKTARAKYLDTGRLSNYEFEALLEIDPSPTKKYIDWLCESLIRNGGVTHDYAYSMPALIGQFHQMAEDHLFPGVDINKVEPSVAALKNLIQTQEKKYMERAFNLASLAVGKDYEEVQSPSHFRIFRILSYKASKKLGSGTNWCIVPNEQKFNDHFANSQIYFVINKDNFKDKYAVTVFRKDPSRHTTMVTVPENRDMGLRNFEELTDVPVDLLVKASKDPGEKRSTVSSLVSGKDYEEIQSPSHFRIFKVLSSEAAQKLGSGSGWCTCLSGKHGGSESDWCLSGKPGGPKDDWCLCCVAQDDSVFKQYLAVNHILYVINRNNPKDKYAVMISRKSPSVNSSRVVNSKDHEVRPQSFEGITGISIAFLIKAVV